jgi:hypothetical protein
MNPLKLNHQIIKNRFFTIYLIKVRILEIFLLIFPGRDERMKTRSQRVLIRASVWKAFIRVLVAFVEATNEYINKNDSLS